MNLEFRKEKCGLETYLEVVSLNWKSLSCVRLFATPWSIARQAPLSREFSRQEYWSGLPFLSPGDFHNPGSESGSPELKADSLPFESPGKPQTAIKTKRVDEFYSWSENRSKPGKSKNWVLGASSTQKVGGRWEKMSRRNWEVMTREMRIKPREWGVVGVKQVMCFQD